MLLNCLVLALILMLTGYYAAQGTFSAALSLVAAVFSSLIAMAWFEPRVSTVMEYAPVRGAGMARGICVLFFFMIALSLTRLAANKAVPKNIRTTKMIDSIGGGVMGFLTALIVVGTCVIGFDVMSLPTDALGFDRFPDETRMKGDQPGIAAAPRNVWFAPDQFTLAIWGLGSGRGLGGDHSFASVHPNFVTESYGYRNVVAAGSDPVLIPNLLSVDGVYFPVPADVMAKYQAPGDKQGAVVRIEVKKGEAARDSADSDGMFRISASEIRMVTEKGVQLYPLGHLDGGRKFEATPLDTGHVTDDYVDNKVLQDWVFALDPGDKPLYLEVKALARAQLSARIKDTALPQLAVTEYPKREYRFNQGSVLVTVKGSTGPIDNAIVYVVNPTTKAKYVQGVVQDAYNAMTKALTDINNGVPPWSKEMGTPGVPTDADMKRWYAQARSNVTLAKEDDPVQWSQVVPTVMMGSAGTNGRTNVEQLPKFFETTMIPTLGNEPNAVLGHGTTGANGTVEISQLSPGHYEVIVSGSQPDAYYCWTTEVTISPHNQTKVDFEAKGAAYSAVLKP